MTDEEYLVKVGKDGTPENASFLLYVCNLEATAYHEAGHVVAAITLGIPFEYATIDAEHEGCIARGAVGMVNTARVPMYCDPFEPSWRPARAKRRAEAVVQESLSGGLAEKHYLENYASLGGSQTVCEANARIAEHLEKFTVGDRFVQDWWRVTFECLDLSLTWDEWMSALSVRAKTLVIQKWSQIHAVAQELCNENTLYAPYLKQVVKRVESAGPLS